MYKTIIVGTDGSQTAARAVEHATDVAKAFGAKLHVVSAYRPVSEVTISTGDTPMMMPDQLDQLDKELKGQVEGMLGRVTDGIAAQGVDVEAHPIAGDPADALLDLAEAIHADLIVVGSRGMGGVKRFLLGSVPNNVSHHAKCNVLIVHTDA